MSYLKNKRYKPLVDKFFWIISLPTAFLILALIVTAAFYPTLLFIAIPLALLVIYVIVSPLFGYVELRENSVYIKYGLLLKKEIPYDKIRGTVKERKLYSDSMMSLKNAFEHVNIKYNTFDVVTVSVVDNDTLIKELEDRLANK